MVLKNKNIIFKIRTSKVTDYAALRVCNKKIVFLFLKQNIVVGTQKNHLNETVLLSTQNIMLKWIGKNILTILH